ncbi:MAG: PspC domain-containing protein [Candidatus Heimdallarchaeota archaeon]|nr:PspC domain-containing protein [Candidatus Heimdallarchaeota archaeon]
MQPTIYCTKCGKQIGTLVEEPNFLNPSLKYVGPKKFVRPRERRIIAGVCVALADYYNIDVLVIRLAFMLLSFVGGIGFIIYLVLIGIIPESQLDPWSE